MRKKIIINIRYAKISDIDFGLSLDEYISIEELIKKINNSECLGYVKTGSLFLENEPEELLLIKKIST